MEIIIFLILGYIVYYFTVVKKELKEEGFESPLDKVNSYFEELKNQKDNEQNTSEKIKSTFNDIEEKDTLSESDIDKLGILAKCNIKNISHMTHINNLENILKHGLLAHNNPYKRVDISNAEVNGRRDRLEPIYNKPIHYYVPFYFNPRNAMLYRNQKQFGDKIIILGFKNNIVLKQNLVYTNANAAADNTYYTNKIEELCNREFIDFNKVFSSSWNNYGNPDYQLKQVMMAEILVPEKVDFDMIDTITCSSYSIRQFILNNFNTKNINVIIDSSKFF